MHIAVDLRILDRAGMERTGIGRQALAATLALHAARPTWMFTVHSNRVDLIASEAGLRVLPTRWPTAGAAGRQAWLHLAAVPTTRPAPDLWWSPTFVLPLAWRGPAVVTVLDLVFQLRPELYRRRLGALYFARATRRSARRAGRILCPSAATGERVVAELAAEPRKVVIAPCGVAAAFRSAPARRDGDYVLFVGRWEARKGLDVLHAALRELAARGSRPRLVLAGGPGWDADDAVRALRSDPAVETVVDPNDERLAELYAGAGALVYPSRMEGFGLPVAEAMSCGCPVIASDLPEIRGWAGDAPAYVAPGDSAGLAETLASVADDPERRERMAERGRAIAAGLTWEAYTEIAIEAIQAAVAERSAAR